MPHFSGSYIGDRYEATLLYSNNYLKMNENGGITDDRYITRPEEMAEGKKEYESQNIPTLLSKSANRNKDFTYSSPNAINWDSRVKWRKPKMTQPTLKDRVRSGHQFHPHDESGTQPPPVYFGGRTVQNLIRRLISNPETNW